MMTQGDENHDIYKTAANTPNGSRSSREQATNESVMAIMDNEHHGTKYSHGGSGGPVSYYGHGALVLLLVFQVIIVCVLEGLQLQHTTARMSSDCTMTLDVIEISQVGLVYRGLVMAATLYQLLFCLDTLQQQSTIHLCMLLVNGKHSVAHMSCE